MPNPSQGFDGKGYNLGKLTTDHANTPQLNQILLTVTKPINPSVTGFALSFNI